MCVPSVPPSPRPADRLALIGCGDTQVVQKMFEYGTAAQKARLVSTMEGQVLGLSLQMYGCRVVQKVRAFVLCSLLVPKLTVRCHRRSSMSTRINR